MGKWVFTDTAVSPTDTYTFAVNANSDQEQYAKTETVSALIEPGSPPLIFEGQDQPTSITLSGTFLSQAQQEAMKHWYGKRHQFLLTDDRGYQRWVYPSAYQLTRKPSALYAWRADWQMTLTLFSATFPA